MDEKRHILLIDDDRAFCQGVVDYLNEEQFKVTAAFDGETALEMLEKNSYDAILLDIMLPRINGFRMFKYIREVTSTPILFLTAKTEPLDEIVGLELGSDDYIKKPCNMRVLLTRINKVLKQNETKVETIILVGNLELNTKKRSLEVNNCEVALTKAEYRIIEFLCENLDSACSKEDLIEYAFERAPFDNDRSVDVIVSRLRKKLREKGWDNGQIETVHGYGYRLNKKA